MSLPHIKVSSLSQVFTNYSDLPLIVSSNSDAGVKLAEAVLDQVLIQVSADYNIVAPVIV